MFAPLPGRWRRYRRHVRLILLIILYVLKKVVLTETCLHKKLRWLFSFILLKQSKYKYLMSINWMQSKYKYCVIIKSVWSNWEDARWLDVKKLMEISNRKTSKSLLISKIHNYVFSTKARLLHIGRQSFSNTLDQKYVTSTRGL